MRLPALSLIILSNTANTPTPINMGIITNAFSTIKCKITDRKPAMTNDDVLIWWSQNDQQEPNNPKLVKKLCKIYMKSHRISKREAMNIINNE